MVIKNQEQGKSARTLQIYDQSVQRILAKSPSGKAEDFVSAALQHSRKVNTAVGYQAALLWAYNQDKYVDLKSEIHRAAQILADEIRRRKDDGRLGRRDGTRKRQFKQHAGDGWRENVLTKIIERLLRETKSDVHVSEQANRERLQRKELSHAIFVLYLTGCRISELHAGVRIEFGQSGDLICWIENSHRPHGEGKSERPVVLSVDGASSDVRRHVIRSVSKLAGTSVAISTRGCTETRKKSIEKRINGLIDGAARELGMGKTTTRSFRDQVSGDLKASGASEIEIAAVLGHTSSSKQRYYGQKRNGECGKSVKSTPAYIKSLQELIQRRSAEETFQRDIERIERLEALESDLPGYEAWGR